MVLALLQQRFIPATMSRKAKAKKPLHIKNHFKTTLHKLPLERQPSAYTFLWSGYDSFWHDIARPDSTATAEPYRLARLLLNDGYQNMFDLLKSYGSMVGEPWMLEQAVYRLRRLCRLAAAVCRGATASAPMQWQIDDYLFKSTPVAAEQPFISDYYWKEWLGICLLCRDADSLAGVLQYHVSWGKTSELGCDEAQWLVQYLQLAAQQDPALLAFHEAYFPRIIARYDNVGVILPVFLAVQQGDAEAFEQAVIFATQYRQRWYTKGITRSPYDQFGLLPPLLIAAVAMGYDRYGWRLQHRNEYLPNWWLENQFDDYVAQVKAGADLRAQVLGFPKIKFTSV